MFSVDRGSLQGDSLSPMLWIVALQFILKARDPNLRGRWKENRKPGEYEESGVDCFVRQQCGVCAAEYPTKVVNAAAAAELEPDELSDATSEDEEETEAAAADALNHLRVMAVVRSSRFSTLTVRHVKNQEARLKWCSVVS